HHKAGPIGLIGLPIRTTPWNRSETGWTPAEPKGWSMTPSAPSGGKTGPPHCSGSHRRALGRPAAACSRLDRGLGFGSVGEVNLIRDAGNLVAHCEDHIR